MSDPQSQLLSYLASASGRDAVRGVAPANLAQLVSAAEKCAPWVFNWTEYGQPLGSDFRSSALVEVAEAAMHRLSQELPPDHASLSAVQALGDSVGGAVRAPVVLPRPCHGSEFRHADSSAAANPVTIEHPFGPQALVKPQALSVRALAGSSFGSPDTPETVLALGAATLAKTLLTRASVYATCAALTPAGGHGATAGALVSLGPRTAAALRTKAAAARGSVTATMSLLDIAAQVATVADLDAMPVSQLAALCDLAVRAPTSGDSTGTGIDVEATAVDVPVSAEAVTAAARVSALAFKRHRTGA
jgi:hypothetical protein